MRLTIRTAATSAALCFAAACAPRQTAGRAPSGDRNQISQDEILKNHFNDAYSAVESLRPAWLSVRGMESLSAPTPVWVYVDNTRRGGVDELREIAPTLIEYIRHYDAPAANARWGAGHNAGVIFVSLRPTGTGK